MTSSRDAVQERIGCFDKVEKPRCLGKIVVEEEILRIDLQTSWLLGYDEQIAAPDGSQF